ncbi:hypothetical protein BOTBODRAFT_178962 [Botryobasidium botryosum FD-172 SS1]|uniref:PLD phosphodiesterase domain-containing protein n=1 Tax=Botryobasidium botryosum (strain FD-172 SS1) TaxID=930990 RepID=A0A067M1D7_BOTB1|nr:hypothetical protein BOTBODRAFT_178962 [Botryobasidium botryosum FD-172 SS1]
MTKTTTASSDHVLHLCASTETIASELAKDPSQPVEKVVEALRKKWNREDGSQPKHEEAYSLDRAAECGKFPYRPSDLFLKIYSDVLGTLNADSLAGLTAPSLLGASGTIPLSIVSVIPDIMRHYADLIVHAQHEAFIATNYWEPSNAAKIISDALRELSKRCERDGRKVVVKFMYDRGTPSQMYNNHALVHPDGWEQVGLPKPDEIQHISLEVVNYHRPLLGTFHAKYMVVDRKVACINSNNMQDRPNLEMMVHLEGPIVQSFYDMALLSWSNALNPPLPLLSNPPDLTNVKYKFQYDNEHLQYIDTEFMSKASRALLGKQHEAMANHPEDDGVGQDGSRTKAAVRTVAGIHGADGGELGTDDLIGQHPAMNVPSQGESEAVRDKHRDANADANSNNNNNDQQLNGNGNGAATATNGSSQQAKPHGGSDSPPTVDGQNDGQTPAPSLSPSNKSRGAEITKLLNADGKYDATTAPNDEASLDDFMPHIMHEPHDPVPIAMVNRHPQGKPCNTGEHTVPQDVAWLSALKNAQQSVFIQSPTLNASPVVPAIIEACQRGVVVTIYLSLGYNDLGEMLPGQGGTNEQVVHTMYETLNKDGKQDRLRVHWYTGKDQVEPMGAAAKKRSSHVKYMSVDDQIAILGNGNQDTQSWFHSQEVNILVDSPQIVREWHRGIDANQNTGYYGRVSDKDGVWRAPDGRAVESSGTKSAGIMGVIKGLGAAVARVRGTGGF